MRCNSTIKKRVFSMDAITEEEGLILRTLLNLNNDGIRKSLKGDELYWSLNLDEESAVKIGCEIRDKIFKMVDDK